MGFDLSSSSINCKIMYKSFIFEADDLNVTLERDLEIKLIVSKLISSSPRLSFFPKHY